MDRRSAEQMEQQRQSEERRRAFYDAELRGWERSRVRPEEPNARVYLRAIDAIVETARRGLGERDFREMLEVLARTWHPEKT